MSSPPSDGNVNARSTDPKPVVVSRIPRSGRHSPFSINAIGSPRVENVPPPSRNVASPTVSSKLPRKSQTPSQLPSLRSTRHGGSVASTRSVLPTRGAPVSIAMTTATATCETKASPPSNRDKPLPSPPMAQVVDPNSPAKAQRTLVDAESGSLSQSDWPILRPEDVSKLATDTNNDHLNSETRNIQQNQQKQPQQQQNRSASDGAAPKEISNPYFVNRDFKSSAAAEIDAAWVSDKSPAQETDSHRPQSQQTMQPRALRSRNPYTSSYHAMSTGPDESMESPLARKTSAPAAIMIPPRMSSKRSSLPLSTQAEFDTSSPLPELQLAESADTRSPVLDGRQSPQHKGQGSNHEVSENAKTVVTARAEINSVSDWSLGGASSFKREPELLLNCGTRIRRLSRLGPGIGPVLTIFPDAEEVLRGPSDQVPEIPSSIMPDRPSNKLIRERSLGSFEDKISREYSSSTITDVFFKHGTPRLSSNAITESASQRSPEGSTATSTPVMISPIRSMRPPRKTTSEDVTSSLSPAVSPIASGPKNINPVQRIASQPYIADTSVPDALDYEMEPIDTVKQQQRLSNGPNVARKASQLLGITRAGSVAAAAGQRVPMKAISPSFASTKSTATNEAHSKTSPSLSSDEKFSSRNATVKSSMSGSSSQTAIRTGKSHDTTRSHGPSKLRASESVTPIRSDKRSTSGAPLNFANVPGHTMASVGFVSPVGRKAEKPKGKKVKGKRSIRDFFLKRDTKHPELPQQTIVPKRSFMSETRSTIAKRLSSKNLSKVHVSLKQVSQPDLKSVLKRDGNSTARPTNDSSPGDVNHHAALSSLEASASEMPVGSSPSTIFNTAKVVSSIVNHVSLMSPEASDRLRGLEIAEALIQSIECCKTAEMHAEKARKYARHAELSADRAELGMKHIVSMCEPELNSETQHFLRDYIKIASLNRMESQEDSLDSSPDT